MSITVRAALAALISAALVTVFVPPAHADGRLSVHHDEVCVVVRHGGQVTNRYVLTQFVVTHLDADGETLGTAETTPWKRWPRREHLRMWIKFCGPKGLARQA